MRVLLVEDDEVAQAMFKRFLVDSMAASVRTAIALADALAAIVEEPFDVCLLDLSLVDSEANNTIVAFPFRDVATVVITGDPREQTGYLAVRAGAKYVYRKDIDDLSLLGILMHKAVKEYEKEKHDSEVRSAQFVRDEIQAERDKMRDAEMRRLQRHPGWLESLPDILKAPLVAFVVSVSAAIFVSLWYDGPDKNTILSVIVAAAVIFINQARHMQTTKKVVEKVEENTVITKKAGQDQQAAMQQVDSDLREKMDEHKAEVKAETKAEAKAVASVAKTVADKAKESMDTITRAVNGGLEEKIKRAVAEALAERRSTDRGGGNAAR